MSTHHGGTAVRPGLYLSRATWDITVVPRPGGVLPGSPATLYIRFPALVLFLLAPLLGGLYVIFLPFIGFALLARYGARRAAIELRRVWTISGLVARVSSSHRKPGP